MHHTLHAPSFLADAEAAAATAAPSTSSDAAETVFYEGSGSNAELALSVLLGFTLIYAPLTIASLGRRAWFKYRFTNKRVTVTNSSPLFKNEVRRAGGWYRLPCILRAT